MFRVQYVCKLSDTIDSSVVKSQLKDAKDEVALLKSQLTQYTVMFNEQRKREQRMQMKSDEIATEHEARERELCSLLE